MALRITTRSYTATGALLALLLAAAVATSMPAAADARGNPQCFFGRRRAAVGSNCKLPGQNAFGIVRRNPKAPTTCVCVKPSPPPPAPVSVPTPGSNKTCKDPATGVAQVVASNCVINASQGKYGVWRLNPRRAGFCLCAAK